MKKLNNMILVFLGVFGLIFIHTTVWSANYPLEITQPQPNLATANRYYKTYPGLEYKVRVGAIGGLYPYTYSFSSAPTGMVINQKTGIITWPNPVTSGSPHNIIVSITDSEGTTVTRSWTLTVSTSGIYFIDATNGSTVANGGLGTSASPWRTLDDLLEAGTVSADTMAYFKTGIYNLDNLTLTSHGGYGSSKDVPSTKPVIWLAYPGHSPTIDFGSSGYADPAPYFGIWDNDIYISGFTLTNCWNFCFQGIGSRAVFAWNTFSNLRSGTDGANSAFIMTAGSGVGTRHYTYIHNNSFSNVFTNPSAPGGAFVKFYSETKSIVEENTWSNQNGSNSASQEGISWKAYNTYSVTRKNSINYITDHSIGGSANQNGNSTFEFNLVRNCSSEGVIVNEFGTEGPAYYYRNTFACPVTIRNTDSADGPFVFTNNVIVNSTTTYNGLSYINVSAPARIQRTNDLTGSPATGIVDSNGALDGTYRDTYFGSRGFETGLNSPPRFRVVSQ